MSVAITACADLSSMLSGSRRVKVLAQCLESAYALSPMQMGDMHAADLQRLAVLPLSRCMATQLDSPSATLILDKRLLQQPHQQAC